MLDPVGCVDAAQVGEVRTETHREVGDGDARCACSGQQPRCGCDDGTNGATANWQREFRIYASGLLRSLPAGLTALQCYGAEDRGAQGLWLWLEDVGEQDERAWSTASLERVARHLSTFNGAYLVDRTLPTAPWLSSAWLRTWVGSLEPLLPADPAGMLAHPLAGRLVPAEDAGRFVRLWQERACFLTALDRLPLTFCHHDLHRHNVFLSQSSTGWDQSVAIDWEGAGTGAVGEDLAPLVMSCLHAEGGAGASPRERDAHAFASYVDGLRTVGWRGEPRPVRFAYATRAALREAALIWRWIRRLATGRLSPEYIARYYACSVDEVAERHTQAVAFLLDLAR
jgi:hypothetical protein